MAATSSRRSRRCVLLLACLTIFALQSPPAFGQVSEPQEPGTGLPEQPPALPEAPPPRYDFEHNITGDWFGLRNSLSDQGLELTGGYAMEFLGNPAAARSRARPTSTTSCSRATPTWRS